MRSVSGTDKTWLRRLMKKMRWEESVLRTLCLTSPMSHGERPSNAVFFAQASDSAPLGCTFPPIPTDVHPSKQPHVNICTQSQEDIGIPTHESTENLH